MVAFTFTVWSQPASRKELIQACAQYNPGITVIRDKFDRHRDGRVRYIIDVYEATPYGIELLDWLKRGREYEKQRKKDPNFCPYLTGPVWALEDATGKMDERYPPWELHFLSAEQRHR
jgi:hypothetical protein